jgi:hypothetical protein
LKGLNEIRIVDPMLHHLVDHVEFADLRTVGLGIVVEIEYSAFLHLGHYMWECTRCNHGFVGPEGDNDVAGIPVVENQIVDLIHMAIELDLDTLHTPRLEPVIVVG